MKLTGIVKKEFLKIVGGSLLGLSVLGCSGDKIDSKKYVDNSKYYEECSIIDTKINDVNYRMMGVYHAGWFMDEYFNIFEDYIKNCSLVITEAGPEELPYCSSTAYDFFDTVVALAREYDKDIVTLDSFNSDMYFFEILQGWSLWFATVFALGGTFYELRKKKKKKIEKKIKKAAIIGLGAYLTLGSFIPGMMFKHFLGIPYSKSHYFYSGIEDQRNIEITKRTLNLDKYISKEKLKDGDYVLMIFGDAHAKGFDVYTESPNFRKFKSLLYTPTYNLIDKNEISKFSYEKGEWQKEVLKK